MKKGDRVVFRTSHLGVLEGPDDTRFVRDVKAMRGDTGTYLGPHPMNATEGLEDWHLAEFEKDGKTYIVPGHVPAHFNLSLAGIEDEGPSSREGGKL